MTLFLAGLRERRRMRGLLTKTVAVLVSLIMLSLRPNEAPAFLTIDLRNDAYKNFLDGMLTGDFGKRLQEVESYLYAVAQLFQQAYPGKTVNVVVYHFGSYSMYPSSFNNAKIESENGQWRVLYRVVSITNAYGSWEVEWNR
jgi:hypothetical protein